MAVCKVCGQEYRKLYEHVRNAHSLSKQEYYDRYFKRDGEGICVICGNPAKFNDGKFCYDKTCSTSCRTKLSHQTIDANPEYKAEIVRSISETNSKTKGGRTLKTYKNPTQTIYCPYCDFSYISNSALTLKNHLENEHGLVIGEMKNNTVWAEFLRNEYWPRFRPEESCHCRVCGKPTWFDSFTKGFARYCGKSCQLVEKHNSDPATWPDRLKALADKREYDNDFSCLFQLCQYNLLDKIDLSPRVWESPHEFMAYLRRLRGTIRYTENYQRKYGVSRPVQRKEIQDKIKATNLERYGTEVTSKNPEVIAKCRETWDSKTPEELESYKEKMKATNLERYGHVCSIHGEEVWKKVRASRDRNRGELWYKSFLTWLSLNDLTLLSSKQDYLDRSNVFLKCNKCGNEFEFTFDHYIQYEYCPKCYNPYSSSQENLLNDFLNRQGIATLRNQSMIDTSVIDRNGISRKVHWDVDIYLPDYKLGIEVDGLQWHSEISPTKHLEKMELLWKQHSAQLLHITDSEINNHLEVVQSIILAKCGIFHERIYARQCEIQEIEDSEYRSFVEQYHIQGFANALVPLGMFHKGKLVAVCSFGASRFGREDGKPIENELIRFCCLPFTQIVGGLSKFVKHYLREYPSSIPLVSFCDRRFSDGNSYLKSGFIQVGIVPPRYWYWSGNKDYFLHHRMGFQKSRLAKKFGDNYDPNLTEHENCLRNGWYRYYDCGSLKMLYTGGK